MAKKTKRISVNAFEKAVNAAQANCTTVTWNEIEISVKHILSISEVIEFVDYLVDLCFVDGRGYTPEVFDFGVRQGLLTRYANFSMPDNIEKQYSLVCGSDAAETVSQCVNQGQLREVVAAANRRIEHRLDVDAKMVAMVKINEAIDIAMGFAEGVMDKLNRFGDVDVQQMLDMLQGMGEGDGSVAESVVSAYMEQLQSAEPKREVDGGADIVPFPKDEEDVGCDN